MTNTTTAQAIPFMDLKQQYLSIKDEILLAVAESFENTDFTNGQTVRRFEQLFSAYCEARFCEALNNGTSAVHMALAALGVGPGDEVIIPANTFIATAWGASYCGATPVFIDCDPDSWNIDPTKIEAAITSKTKAIAGVHLYGQPYELDDVIAVAKKHGLRVMEDCAQAHGARYKGKRVGAISEVGSFSFYPGKNLGAYGEGGAIVTNDEGISKHVQSMRNHGSTVRYYHDEIGYNYRMSGDQGAVLSVKMKYIEQWTARRQAIAKLYRDGINNSKIQLQHTPAHIEPVYHLFVVKADNRDNLQRHLTERNIHPGQHYPVPCHLQKAYTHLGYKQGSIPVSEDLASRCLSLPMFPELTDEQVARVIDAVNRY